jgi:hypothetical protein
MMVMTVQAVLQFVLRPLGTLQRAQGCEDKTSSVWVFEAQRTRVVAGVFLEVVRFSCEGCWWWCFDSVQQAESLVGGPPLCGTNKQLQLTRRLGRKRVEEGEVSRGGDSKEGRKDEKGMKMDVSLHVLSFFLSFTR